MHANLNFNSEKIVNICPLFGLYSGDRPNPKPLSCLEVLLKFVVGLQGYSTELQQL
jgi:hypothetical protein